MDGRGRLAQSLTWIAPLTSFWRASGRARPSGRAASHAATHAYAGGSARPAGRSAIRRWLRRSSIWVFNVRVPSGAGLAATGAFLFATLAYGLVIGDRAAVIVGAFRDARDAAANAAGFRIAAIALSGERHVSREEILASAGVTGTTSLLFLDVEAARDRLKTNPWIADATVLKLFPDRLQIGIKEREAFALWQQRGRVSVIADDGTVLEPYVDPRLTRLPLVVGAGAAARAKDFLALLDRYPELRDQVRASVLIGERRWNLRLRNGLDIRLPETGAGEALATLVALDRDKKLLSRDILWVDLRLPDRVTVELSEAAAAQRAEALKDKKPAKKGGAA
ncbi:MAG TPA: FtsQ-type POTRA domain-containing protein [Xanthobacteraceae bacterium]